MSFNDWRCLLHGQTDTVSAIEQFANHSKTAMSLQSTAKSAGAAKEEEKESVDALNARIAKIISAAPIMLFMKGTSCFGVIRNPVCFCPLEKC